VTVNAPRAVVTVAPGSTGTVKLDLQRMIDGAGGYRIAGTSSDPGITVTPVSGQFGADGSASVDVAITAARTVPGEYYVVFLTTTKSIVFVIVTAEPDEP
jgi:hypothetical protein